MNDFRSASMNTGSSGSPTDDTPMKTAFRRVTLSWGGWQPQDGILFKTGNE
jgi:hypothetical protein